MVDIKISQLSNVASSELTDLFEISRSTGAGTWESRSIEYNDLMRSLQGAHVVTVGSQGASATTIEEGIELALGSNIGPPSATNPVVIKLQPGIYTEPALVIPNYTTIMSDGGNKSVFIYSDDPDNVMFTMSLSSALIGVSLRNASGTNGCAIKSISTTGDSLVEDIVIRDCYNGIWASGAGASIRCYHCSIIPFNTTSNCAIKVDGGGVINASSTIIRTGGTGALTYGIYVNGVGSKINMNSFNINDATNGFYVNNGGVLNTDGGYFENCTYALRIDEDGSNSRIETYATSIQDSVVYDCLIESSTGIVIFIGKMDYNKRSIVSGGIFNTIGMDEENEILKLTGKTNIEETLDVGVPGAYVEGYSTGLDVGEGGSYLTDNYGNEIVEYWKYDDSAVSGSKFTRYTNNAGTQLTDEDDAIIVASKYSFSAVRLDIITAANVGSNSFVVEHWDGNSWEYDAICGYKKSDFTHRGVDIFQNIETQYVEVGTGINDDWVSDRNVLDEIPDWDSGIDMYPIRFRNNGGSLITAMNFSNGKVRGDDFDVSESKKIIVWGRFRQQVNELVKVGELAPSSLYPPSSEIIQISPNIASNVSSRLIDGSVCATGFAIVSPDWIDTSSGVRLIVSMYSSNSSAGNVEIKVRYLPLSVGFVFDGTATEYSQSIVVASPGVEKQIFLATHLFDISSFAPNVNFFISIERDATAGNTLDTYAGDVIITGLKVVWTRKRLG